VPHIANRGRAQATGARVSELKARYEPIAAAPATAEIPDLFG
jgi:hypothetical protein